MTALVEPATDRERFDADRVVDAPEMLRAFNDLGVLRPADVHVARGVCRLVGEERPDVLLATALAVRAPRLGHVCVDLGTVRATATSEDDAEVDVEALPWPDDVDGWRAAVADSGAVTVGAAPGETPLRLVERRLYLDRYWGYERDVIAQVNDRAAAAGGAVDPGRLREGLDRFFGPLSGEGGARDDAQRQAARTAVLRRFAVIAGGPGTGKTWTIARLLALLLELGSTAGGPLPRVALAAPTGKAANRMGEEVAAAAVALSLPPRVQAAVDGIEASTIHRLLGSRPDSDTRFWHHAGAPLPHDVVIVDETSMVSLSLMAKLLTAARPEARVVLVGDPEQLASVEAGAVLGDIVGPAAEGRGAEGADDVESAMAGTTPTGGEGAVQLSLTGGAATPAIADAVVVLQRVHRFRQESGIADLARAIQVGDVGGTLAVLRSGRVDVAWIELPGEATTDELADAVAPLRTAAVEAGAALHAGAATGDAPRALEALRSFRLLCAHRRGPWGVATWGPGVERWLEDDIRGFDAADEWYVGRPVLVTKNDHQLRLFNGDQGVVVSADEGAVTVAFPDGSGVRGVRPSQLEAVETVHAMTVHKSQGSQFGHVAVVLPGPTSRILTRELLYTAVTRAEERVTLVGSEDAVAAAVTRRIHRASGIREALWGGSAQGGG